MDKFFEKEFEFHIYIYGYILTVVATTDIERSVKERNITGTDFTGTRALHFVYKGEARSMIVLPFDATINEISHESCHVAQNIIGWIEAKYDDREFVAYLFAHIVQGVYEFHERAIVDYVAFKKKAKKVKKVLDKPSKK